MAWREGTILVPVSRGRFHAVIDAEDADAVLAHRWYAVGKGLYPATMVDGRRVRLHNFLMRPSPGFVVDHINGDSLDNRRVNLRICTVTQNNWNTSRYSACGFKGVRRHGPSWAAGIVANEKRYYLGTYRTAEDAARAYDAAATQLHGEFARLNFPNRKAA